MIEPYLEHILRLCTSCSIHFREVACIWYFTPQVLAFFVNATNSYIAIGHLSRKILDLSCLLPPCSWASSWMRAPIPCPLLLQHPRATAPVKRVLSTPFTRAWRWMCEAPGSEDTSRVLKEAPEAAARRGELRLGMCLWSCFQEGKLWSASKNPVVCVPFDKKGCSLQIGEYTEILR